MLDDLNDSAALGKNIYGQVSSGNIDGHSLADSAFDVISGSPLDKLTRMAVDKIDEGFTRFEKHRIIESVKQKFHQAISQKVAVKISSFTTPSVNAGDRKTTLQAKVGDEWLDKAKEVYDQHHKGHRYQIQRKLQDMARGLKKDPIKLVNIPLSLVPLGDIAKLPIKAGGYVAGKYTEARRERRKKEYLDTGNAGLQLQATIGADFARKKAKWQAKDIAELGPLIQRNLYKLKQAVIILNQKSKHMDTCATNFRKAPTNEALGLALARSRESTAMSLYEVKHYIDKITEKCDEMDATATTIKAYMKGLNIIADACSGDIKKTF